MFVNATVNGDAVQGFMGGSLSGKSVVRNGEKCP
jgi:hypothetical protein